MKLPLEAIVVGDRRREDYGDIAGLAASIQTYGLLHPIVVDDTGALVAGERRLRAVESLGWESVDVRDIGELSDAERAEIELEENLQRKDLTAGERSKTLVKLVEAVQQIDLEQATPCADSAHGQFSEQPGSRRRAAERIGVPETTIREAQQHVEIMEKIPVLAGPDVKQYHALEAREKLERLPEDERPKAVALVSQPGIPPKAAVEILGNLATKPADDRARIFEKAASADSRDRSDALTEAAEKPSMPDPRIAMVMDAAMTLGKAARLFPNDAMNDDIGLARDTVKDLLANLKEYRRDD